MFSNFFYKNLNIIGAIAIIFSVSIILFTFLYLFYFSKKDNFDNLPIQLPLPSVAGRYVKILAPEGLPINIAGVFIYDSNGNNLIRDKTVAMASASMNTVYAPANNALNIIFATDSAGQNNINRNINNPSLVFNNYTYTRNDGSAYVLSQNWQGFYDQGINANIAHSMGGDNSSDYWQYDFGTNVNIAAVEIYTRVDDCCTNRSANLRVQVINNNGYTYNLNNPSEFLPVIISTVLATQTTTAGATSTTAGATSTTMGDTSPTMSMSSNNNIGDTNLITDNIPITTPTMITNLLDNGLGIDYLTSQGIGLNNKLRGPSTNIVQTNFSGTSNVYSPYLYYNKGNTERFMGKLYHPYP